MTRWRGLSRVSWHRRKGVLGLLRCAWRGFSPWRRGRQRVFGGQRLVVKRHACSISDCRASAPMVCAQRVPAGHKSGKWRIEPKNPKGLPDCAPCSNHYDLLGQAMIDEIVVSREHCSRYRKIAHEAQDRPQRMF